MDMLVWCDRTFGLDRCVCTWMLQMSEIVNPHLLFSVRGHVHIVAEKESQMLMMVCMVHVWYMAYIEERNLWVCCLAYTHSRDLQLMKLRCRRVACQINMSSSFTPPYVSSCLFSTPFLAPNLLFLIYLSVLPFLAKLHEPFQLLQPNVTSLLYHKTMKKILEHSLVIALVRLPLHAKLDGSLDDSDLRKGIACIRSTDVLPTVVSSSIHYSIIFNLNLNYFISLTIFKTYWIIHVTIFDDIN